MCLSILIASHPLIFLLHFLNEQRNEFQINQACFSMKMQKTKRSLMRNLKNMKNESVTTDKKY